MTGNVWEWTWDWYGPLSEDTAFMKRSGSSGTSMVISSAWSR